LQGAKAILRENNIRFFSDPLQCAAGSDLQVFLTPWPGYKALDLWQLKALVRRPIIFDAMQTVDFRAAQAVGFSYEGIGRRFSDGPPPFTVD
jgi:hypothetical protein